MTIGPAAQRDAAGMANAPEPGLVETGAPLGDNKWCALANYRGARTDGVREFENMRTLLLPERCEQQGAQESQHGSEARESKSDRTTEPRRVNSRQKREATRTAAPPVRDTGSRRYRHWGINE